MSTHSLNPNSGRGGRGKPGPGVDDYRKMLPPSNSKTSPIKIFKNQKTIAPTITTPSRSPQPPDGATKHNPTNPTTYLSPAITPPANSVPTTTTADVDTSMTDVDDPTIARSNASPFNVINTSCSPNESVIELEFLFQEPQHSHSMALRAGDILHAMCTHFYNQLTIYNNNGRQGRDFTFSGDQLLHDHQLHEET
jgi:hypothetical protein